MCERCGDHRHRTQSIRMVDLKEALAAAKGEIKSTDMESSKQPIGNLSASVQGANHAAN
jgi:hypothetical protein